MYFSNVFHVDWVSKTPFFFSPYAAVPCRREAGGREEGGREGSGEVCLLPSPRTEGWSEDGAEGGMGGGTGGREGYLLPFLVLCCEAEGGCEVEAGGELLPAVEEAGSAPVARMREEDTERLRHDEGRNADPFSFLGRPPPCESADGEEEDRREEETMVGALLHEGEGGAEDVLADDEDGVDEHVGRARAEGDLEAALETEKLRVEGGRLLLSDDPLRIPLHKVVGHALHEVVV